VIFSPATVSRRFPFQRVKRRNCTKNRPGRCAENHFAPEGERANATEHSILPVAAGERERKRVAAVEICERKSKSDESREAVCSGQTHPTQHKSTTRARTHKCANLVAVVGVD